MESEKRAKRPRIGMSNREGATERYEKSRVQKKWRRRGTLLVQCECGKTILSPQ